MGPQRLPPPPGAAGGLEGGASAVSGTGKPVLPMVPWLWAERVRDASVIAVTRKRSCMGWDPAVRGVELPWG